MTEQPVFTVKEWLQRLDQKIDSLDDKLDSKADTVTVVALEARIRELENNKADRRDVTAVSRQFIGFLVTAAGALLVWALTIAQGAGKL